MLKDSHDLVSRLLRTTRWISFGGGALYRRPAPRRSPTTHTEVPRRPTPEPHRLPSSDQPTERSLSSAQQFVPYVSLYLVLLSADNVPGFTAVSRFRSLSTTFVVVLNTDAGSAAESGEAGGIHVDHHHGTTGYCCHLHRVRQICPRGPFARRAATARGEHRVRRAQLKAWRKGGAS